jgi:hypothetical protein
VFLHAPEFDVKPMKKGTILFMLLGERSTVQYFETRISSITGKCPLEQAGLGRVEIEKRRRFSFVGVYFC